MNTDPTCSPALTLSSRFSFFPPLPTLPPLILDPWSLIFIFHFDPWSPTRIPCSPGHSLQQPSLPPPTRLKSSQHPLWSSYPGAQKFVVPHRDMKSCRTCCILLATYPEISRYIWVKNKSWFYTPVMKQPQPIQVSERDSVSIKSQISGSNNDGTCVHYGHLLYLLFPHHPRPLSWKGQYSIKDSCLYTQINFPVQGLVLNGQPNLNLFNQLYWVITYFFSSFLKCLLSRWSNLTAVMGVPEILDFTM